MTQEDKQLLLKDLCARVPYNTRMKWLEFETKPEPELYLRSILNDTIQVAIKSGGIMCYDVSGFLPYLRPMSSMTEEEIDEFTQFDVYDESDYIMPNYKVVDWLNEHHFDYRGLIEKGLAIEVTKENNPYE